MKKHYLLRAFKLTTAIFFFAVMMCSCITTKSSSILVTGERRPAINPTEVKVYIEPPAQYETIGIVESYDIMGEDRQPALDYTTNALKSRAAEVGANGVLLTNTENQSSAQSGYYLYGMLVDMSDVR